MVFTQELLKRGLFLLGILFGSSSHAGDATTSTNQSISSNSSVVGNCMLNAGFGNLQAIKNMARKFGSETVLDMMFSSVNPIFQPALLTKSSDDPAKPVKSIEDMRENKYVQHAITSTNSTPPWVKITADGRIIPALQMLSESGSDKNWTRMPFMKHKGDIASTEMKVPDTSVNVSSRRY